MESWPEAEYSSWNDNAERVWGRVWAHRRWGPGLLQGCHMVRTQTSQRDDPPCHS